MAERRRTVVVLGELPPPVNGQSKNLAAITADIVARPDVRPVICSISTHRLQRGAGAHLRKIGKHLVAWTRLIGQAVRAPRSLYVVADGGRGLIYTSVTVALGRLLGYEIVLQHRTFAYVERRRALMAFVNRALGPNGRHVFLSPGMAQKFFALYQPERRVSIHHNLAQSQAFFRDLRAVPRPRPGGRLRVGMMSNLMLLKGLDVFLDVARRAAAEGLALDFVLAGPAFGPAEAAMIEAALAETGGNLRWLGPVHGTAKLAFFREIDIFLFPTRYPFEAQPNVVLEAICAGAFVIAPDRGCIAEDLARLGGACLARSDERNPAAWYAALARASADPAELTRRRAASLRLVRQEIPRARAGYAEFLSIFGGTGEGGKG